MLRHKHIRLGRCTQQPPEAGARSLDFSTWSGCFDQGRYLISVTSHCRFFCLKKKEINSGFGTAQCAWVNGFASASCIWCRMMWLSHDWRMGHSKSEVRITNIVSTIYQTITSIPLWLPYLSDTRLSKSSLVHAGERRWWNLAFGIWQDAQPFTHSDHLNALWIR